MTEACGHDASAPWIISSFVHCGTATILSSLLFRL